MRCRDNTPKDGAPEDTEHPLRARTEPAAPIQVRWTDRGLVFITEFGGPVDPRNLLRAIEIAADKAGVEDVGVHTLRYSAAVTWLEAGVHMKRETTGRDLRIHRVVLMASTLGKRLDVSWAGGSAVGYVRRLVDCARPSRRYVWQWWRR